MEISADFILLASGPIFVMAILIEYFVFRKSHPEWFDFKDTLSNMTLAIMQQGAEFLAVGINWLFIKTLYTSLFASGWKLFANEMHNPWSWIGLFIAQDFLYYWFHRTSHRCRWFWSAHVAHHSSKFMNFSTALRQSALYPLTGMWLFWLPLAWIGFPPEDITMIVAINLFFQFWIHTELTKKLPYFDYWFNTPSHHRVHHATNAPYIDKNYGGVFIIWDRLFGSFVPETEKCRYGITKEVDFRNPWESTFREFIDMFKESKKEKGLKNKVLRIFAPPDWNP